MAHEIVNLVLWPTLQIEEYEVYLDQWRNPNTPITYESSPNIVVKVVFAIRNYTLLWILEERITDPLGKYIYRDLLLQLGELTILLLEFNALRLCLGNTEPSAEE